MSRTDIKKKYKRIVVKVGSSILTTESGYLSPSKVKSVVDSISMLVGEYKKEVILVSSGAIACGMHILKFKKRPADLALLQAAAAVGQGALMHTYKEYFKQKELRVGQVLLTSDGMHQRERYLNARNTMNALIKLDVVPIVNENDTVATEEIRFGDNDNLAAQVALMVDADLLVVLSDVDGFCVEEHGVSEVLHTIATIDTNLRTHLREVKNGRTVGGMHSKLETGFMLMRLGMPFIIANGKKKNIVRDIFEGLEVGTLFVPSCKRQGSKKRWLAFSTNSKTSGSIIVDAGAYSALVDHGKSLLASGIVGVRGEFKFGDAVRILKKGGTEFAKGITNFSHSDLEKIKGKKTNEIRSMLGSALYQEVVQRDNLVILD
jgi:glutamate 5-kinase